MRYAATEKHEIIRTVEESSLGISRTLRQLGIPKSTFYHWYDRFLTGAWRRWRIGSPPPHQLEQGPRGTTAGPPGAGP